MGTLITEGGEGGLLCNSNGNRKAIFKTETSISSLSKAMNFNKENKRDTQCHDIYKIGIEHLKN